MHAIEYHSGIGRQGKDLSFRSYTEPTSGFTLRKVATISDIRRENARDLLHEHCGGVLARFARKTGMADARVSHLIGQSPTRNIGDAAARQIESAFEKEPGWLDTSHKTDVSEKAATVAREFDVLSEREQEIVVALMRGLRTDVEPANTGDDGGKPERKRRNSRPA